MKGQRLGQDWSFSCDALTGKTVESIIAYYWEGGVFMIVIKLREDELYQRFFLDAGLGFWEEWSKEDALSDLEDCRARNFAEELNLTNKKVDKIECVDTGDLAHFEFSIGGYTFKLKFSNPSIMDSTNVLEAI